MRGYIAHLWIGLRYPECRRALLLHRDKLMETIIGGWVDKQQLMPSFKLMREAGVGTVIALCLTLLNSGGKY